MKTQSKTEQEMREEKCPWPQTIEELNEYINSLVDMEHDYGTAAYAMSLAATAAFYFMSHKVGASGFQASCADLDFLRRTRLMEGPFIILKGEDMLYPQYDLKEKLSEAMLGWREWAAKEASKKLADNKTAHPEIIKHWQELASFVPQESGLS